MTLPASWCRRLFTVPANLVVAAAWLALLPLTLPLALAGDVVRRRRFGLTRTVLLFAAVAVCDIVGLAACFTVAVLRLDAWYRIQQIYNEAIYASLMTLYGMRTEIEGLDTVPRGPVILMLRHAGYFDSFLPCRTLGRRGMQARFILKRALRWLPCLDIVADHVHSCFVGGGNAAEDSARVAAMLDDAGPRDYVVLFPEGGRYTPRRRAEMIHRKAGTPLGEQASRLKHLLPPRLGGALALMAHPTAEADIWFCAHAGLERAGSVAHLCAGTLVGTTVRVRFWHVRHDEIPREPDAHAGWLFERWREMDAWLGGDVALRR